ncbi:hypothetical protein, partial [Bacillus mycoides]|uniref:hypothetical protein n=1 Tax=Bacillus mycoides TaxID=1405 RepID=UPI0027E1EF73
LSKFHRLLIILSAFSHFHHHDHGRVLFPHHEQLLHHALTFEQHFLYFVQSIQVLVYLQLKILN